MIEVEWRWLPRRIARTLAELPAGAVLQLLDARNPEDGAYVQFHRGADAVRGELPGRDDTAVRLSQLGWRNPVDEGNWWCLVRIPDEDGALTRLGEATVAVWRDIHGWDDAGMLRYQAWHTTERRLLMQPALGVPHVDVPAGVPPANPPTRLVKAPAIRRARSVDAHRGADGRPLAPRDELDDAERARIADYLSAAPVVAMCSGFDPDPFELGAPARVPLHLHTDGEWVWSASLGYFVERYGVAPEDALVYHIRACGYQRPDVDTEVLDHISAAL